MSQKTIYCAECMEDISNDEVQWEDDKLYCGRCGSELSPDPAERDLLDEISAGKRRRLYTLEDEEEDEEDDDLEEEDEDEDWEDEEEDEDEDEDLEEEEATETVVRAGAGGAEPPSGVGCGGKAPHPPALPRCARNGLSPLREEGQLGY